MRKTTLHRDASTPLDIAPPARFDASSPVLTDWRTDLAEVGVVAAVAGAVGLFILLPLALIFIPGWLTLWLGLWGVVLIALAPFGALAYMTMRKVYDRHDLMRAEADARKRMLISMWLDIDQDGTLEDEELEAFIRYVRLLWHGGATTASQAQAYGIAGPTWQKYRNALISIGIATAERKRGGTGFFLLPSVKTQPWPTVEKHVRAKAGLLVRSASDQGMLITASPPRTPNRKPITTVSTLGADLDEEP